ncbi:LLM class F420-dependent oxidoreductase [Isoptericola sp. b441]|uniref:LLM class F420-dependent oxidoreductase n=1 Tax=Actinotalea lenta TaxID=3064654 RepID=A0ABT9D7W0_9CELL|nr:MULTISPECIES: LLM class F420-dependent oxidoreductase [unclassified Isoptericola]MDO8106953.1 LLM class F420-dependent oxidoreductase [Isoptericola sp. b441]MDO8121337.1 LLM class F420-dependent oxidoreductase [Isoptericola sp. b490]
MKVGVHLMRFDGVAPHELRDELARTGEAVEDAGIAWVSVMDHYFQMERAGFPHTDPMLEAYTTLGYLAAHTSSAELGVLVTGVTYRHPGLLAKIVASLDVLSGGRAALGLGAAWYDREHAAMGVPFPPLKERFERLEETLQICAQMFDPADEGPYHGTHYTLAETVCRPLPLHHPTVMVGGSGERKTLRLVARYADACNLFVSEPDAMRHKLDVLRRHCEDVGRDPSEIRVTALAGFPELDRGDVDGFVENIRPYADLGVDTVIVRPPQEPSAAWVRERVAPLVPRLAEL